ncbi:hypothetical protein E2C01_091397 [Portunus trituberculatus]|uniref:Uncharacterized protein n=1 Tax=Portunus trituberculatus TaxID=210409 RepID=A0A5B7JNG5_PORTR|nr:hypothetical protein [Portunus trituberculatus]
MASPGVAFINVSRPDYHLPLLSSGLLLAPRTQERRRFPPSLRTVSKDYRAVWLPYITCGALSTSHTLHLPCVEVRG